MGAVMFICLSRRQSTAVTHSNFHICGSKEVSIGILVVNASMLPILYHDYFDLDRIVKSRHSRYPSPSVGVIGSVGMQGQQIVKASFRDISKTT